MDGRNDNAEQADKIATNTTGNPASNTPPAHQAEQPKVEFKTENIGQWASKQEGHFTEQNRKAAEKKQKAQKTRRKVIPIVAIVGSLAIIGLVVWGIFAFLNHSNSDDETPAIAGGSMTDVTNYSNNLMELYKNDGSLQAVENAVKNTLDTNNGREYSNQVYLAQMFFYQLNEDYNDAIQTASNINPDELALDQRISYYSSLYYCHSMLGDTEKADEYFKISYELSLEQGGEGGI